MKRTPENEVMAMMILFSTILEQDDEVIISDPHYACYPNFIRFFGGKPICVPVFEDEGFQYTPAAIREMIRPCTKTILINSPSNPTGRWPGFILKIGRSIRGIWRGTEGKTTIEYEPGVLKDLKAAIENIMVSDCHIMYIVTTAFVIMIPQSGIKIDYHLNDTEDWREGWKQRSVFIVVALLS